MQDNDLLKWMLKYRRPVRKISMNISKENEGIVISENDIFANGNSLGKAAYDAAPAAEAGGYS